MGLGSRELDAALDRYLTEPPEQQETKFTCDKCGFEFYPGDTYYELEGERLCEECSREWLEQQCKTATEEQCFED